MQDNCHLCGAEFDAMWDYCPACLAKRRENPVAVAVANHERLLRLLSRYGHHDRECPLYHEPNLPGDPRCTCGFSKACEE